MYELGALGSVPCTAILGNADQSAVHVEDEITVVITRDMYAAYSKLGKDARHLEEARQREEGRAAARENDQERSALHRPYVTGSAARAKRARRDR